MHHFDSYALDDAAILRSAVPDDAPGLLHLITELAIYEREPDAVRTTVDDLSSALFGPEPSVFAHVVERDGELAGLALWFRNFSTWEGVHGIYLEDLFVLPKYRGLGYGKSLLASLAAVCDQRGYARLEWSVLDWNAPSIEFYKALGARPMDGWTVYRLTGAPLAEVAATAGGTAATA